MCTMPHQSISTSYYRAFKPEGDLLTKRNLALVCMTVLVVIMLANTTFAAADDYVFEPVNAEVKKGDDVTVAVRLVHKPSGKPVANAQIAQTRIDMSPNGMASMAAPLTPLPSQEPGIYAFKTSLSMPGPWLFTISAKVQGEPQAVTGKIVFKANR